MSDGYYSDFQIKCRCVVWIFLHVLWMISNALRGKTYGGDVPYMECLGILLLGVAVALILWLVDTKTRDLLIHGANGENDGELKTRLFRNVGAVAISSINLYILTLLTYFDEGQVVPFGFRIYVTLTLGVMVVAACITYIWFRRRRRKEDGPMWLK